MRQTLIVLVLLGTLAACSDPAPLPSAAEKIRPSETRPPSTSTPPVSETAQPVPTFTPTATVPPTQPATRTPTAAPPLNTLLFTGNIVPARCVQAKIDALGNPDYPYEEVRELIEAADIAVGTLNASLSDFPAMTGCVDTFLLVGRADNAPALARAGFDVMSVATNHIKNCGLSRCGDRAFLDTLQNLRAAGILPVGAGNNVEEALRPVIVESRGIRFAFVSLGEIESSAFASEDIPGIAPLTEANLREAITAARAAGDVVIALPHWGPEYSSRPNFSEERFAQIAVEAGADIIVGNHTHVVQGTAVIEGVPVFYGLGNFMFDQGWSQETQQGVILLLTFEGTRLTGQQLIPVHIDSDGRVHIAAMAEALEVLARITAASPNRP